MFQPITLIVKLFVLNILYLNWSAINPALNGIEATRLYHENFKKIFFSK